MKIVHDGVLYGLLTGGGLVLILALIFGGVVLGGSRRHRGWLFLYAPASFIIIGVWVQWISTIK